MSNYNLHNAKRNKQDEFYTLYEDIEKELCNYSSQLKDKIIYCNCDNPFKSNFVKYFILNFNTLKIKKLIATCYYENAQLKSGRLFTIKNNNTSYTINDNAYKAIITNVSDNVTNNECIDMNELFSLQGNSITTLKSNGDFRSEECITLLQQSDIIITNPPFSLFREYINILQKYNKKLLIIASKNAITYKDFFHLLKDNKVWLGYNNVNKFIQTDNIIKSFGNIGWFTNLNVNKHTEYITLTKQYNEKEYPTYDNYNAIEVSKVSSIPYDYKGIMGVPITFLDKYNPNQFEILGVTDGGYDFSKEAYPIKRYTNAIQHNIDGTIENGSKVNTRACLLVEDTNKVYYTANNVKGKLVSCYCRILIRSK